MSQYYLHLVVLENCPYSEAALSFLNNYKKIKTDITRINHSNKENYKTNDINTFPQIYLKKNGSNGSLLLGGYTELKKAFDLFYHSKYNHDNIKKFKNKYWSKKSILRLIELINN
jgi:glutaredoxin